MNPYIIHDVDPDTGATISGDIQDNGDVMVVINIPASCSPAQSKRTAARAKDAITLLTEHARISTTEQSKPARPSLRIVRNEA